MIIHRIFFFLCAATLLFSTTQVKAQETAFSLREAVKYARENAYSVRNAEYEYAKAKKIVQETAAMGLPQISVGGDLNYNQRIPQQPVPAEFLPNSPPDQDFVLLAFGVPYQSTYRATANMLILDGSYFVALMASRVFKEISRLELSQSRVDITEQIFNAYGNVVVANELVKILERNLESSMKTLNENKAFLEEGFIEQQDVDQIELLVSNLEINILQSKNQASIAMMALKLAMGYPQDQALSLTDDIDVFITLGDVEGLVNPLFDLDSYLPYRSAETQERAAVLSLRNEQMSYLPKITGFYNVSRNSFGNDFNFFQYENFWDFDNNNPWVTFAIVGFGVQWDLFTGMRRYARTQQMRIDLDRASMNKRLVSEQAELDFQRSRSDFDVAVKSLQTSARNRELAKKILETTRAKYREGIASSLDLSQAENQLLDSERTYVNALLQMVSARSALEKITGSFNTY
jgi:outer membrane protein